MRRYVPVTAAIALLIAALPARAIAIDLAGTPQADVLTGTGDPDTISGGAGNDQLLGESGADILSGGPGADDMSGGAGRDAATYADAAAVTVTLDDLANDGAPSEHDNVQTDIEDVYGGPGDDVLEGSAAGNSLDAGAGNDRVIGGGGEDNLYGGEGDDRLQARDGRADVLDCGAGNDIAVVDELDAVTGCEIVDRRPAVPRVDYTLNWEKTQQGTATRLLSFKLGNISPGKVTVEAICRGKACRFDRRQRRASGAVDVRRMVGSVLPAGTVVQVWLRAPDYLSKVSVLRTDSSGNASLVTRCARPDSKRLIVCPGRG